MSQRAFILVMVITLSVLAIIFVLFRMDIRTELMLIDGNSVVLVYRYDRWSGRADWQAFHNGVIIYGIGPRQVEPPQKPPQGSKP